MMINPEYAKPILEVANNLSEASIPFTINVLWDGLQIRFPWCDGDIICHSGSFEHERGYVETYCFPWDEGDVSILSTSEVIIEIINYYHNWD